VRNELRPVVEAHDVRRPVHQGQPMKDIDDAIRSMVRLTLRAGASLNSSFTLSIFKV
jgi:hypothetical protein